LTLNHSWYPPFADAKGGFAKGYPSNFDDLRHREKFYEKAGTKLCRVRFLSVTVADPPPVLARR